MDISDINKVAGRKRVNTEAENLKEKMSRESSKIIKLRVAQDTAYWELQERLSTVRGEHERLQQNVLDVQMQHEVLSARYQSELRARPAAASRLQASRSLADLLQQHAARLRTALSRATADRTALVTSYAAAARHVQDAHARHATAAAAATTADTVENKLDINEEMNLVKAEIAVLKPTIIGKNISVRHSLLMTMLYGKITSHLSNTSAQTCDICKAVPTEMNNLEKVSSKPVSAEIYQYGLSTLHAWIRCMECLLHIAYRLDFEKWAARDASNKEALKTRKLNIQKKFRDEMGLLVDIVKQGSGTSNDGNTARRFFEDAEKTAAITGLNPQLISRFSTILRVISCGEPINVESFATFSYETAHLYVELYSWYYMPSSVHKLLVHGSDIIKHFNLMPIGKLSEEASEARNKDFRKIREHHTRKFNRSATNEDIFNGLLLSSDPYLSSTRPVLRTPKKNCFLRI